MHLTERHTNGRIYDLRYCVAYNAVRYKRKTQCCHNYTLTVNSTIDYRKITDHLRSGVVYNFCRVYLSVHTVSLSENNFQKP